MLVVSFIILIDDGLPVIFRQKRIGLNNKNFKIYKFRTMKRDTPDIPTDMISKKNIAYLKTGEFLRKYSIDELPQLWNIIKGDLVFIGPRPALHNQIDLKEIRQKKGIHKLKPGVTGWAQVNGRDSLSLIDKVEMDYYYLKNKSLILDIKILVLTLFRILIPKNIKL